VLPGVKHLRLPDEAACVCPGFAAKPMVSAKPFLLVGRLSCDRMASYLALYGNSAALIPLVQLSEATLLLATSFSWLQVILAQTLAAIPYLYACIFSYHLINTFPYHHCLCGRKWRLIGRTRRAAKGTCPDLFPLLSKRRTILAYALFSPCPKNRLNYDDRHGSGAKFLFLAKWPAGFACPRCKNGEYHGKSRGRFACKVCKHETTIQCGTLFEGTNKPLRWWLHTLWCLTGQKNGVSAFGLYRIMGFGRLLELCLLESGLSYKTIRDRKRNTKQSTATEPKLDGKIRSLIPFINIRRALLDGEARLE